VRMDQFLTELNTLFVSTYRSICRVEENTLRHLSGNQLTLSEMHMLESVAALPEDERTIANIARALEITPPSATMTIKKLEKKGFITKAPSTVDGRRVRLTLSESGRRAETAHRYFHRRMVRAVAKEMDAQERAALVSGLNKLNAFLREQADPARAEGGTPQ
ncbi:MAG: MarR family transcriptional regulator, partial [Clostridia bacterium]